MFEYGAPNIKASILRHDKLLWRSDGSTIRNVMRG